MRVKIELPPKFDRVSYSIPIRITDINYGNHTGNDALVSILHETRMQWLSRHGYTELNIGGASLIMADLSVEFKAETFYGDVITAELAISEISKISFELYYLLSVNRNDDKVIVAKAKTGMICFDYSARKITTLPLAFNAMLVKMIGAE